MSGSMTQGFALFSREKLKSAVDAVARRRRRGLFLGAGVGVGVFLLLAAGVWLFFSPYREMMDGHGITYWPLMLFAPVSIGLIVFCLIYILGLRNAVREFRAMLVGRVAEFIDPSVVHETGDALPQEERAGDLLVTLGGAPLAGADCFRGNIGGAAAHFTDLRLKREGRTLSGLYFRAVMGRRFAMPLLVFPSTTDVSRSGLEARLHAAGEDVGAGLLRLDDPALGRQILVPSGGEEFVLSMLSAPSYAKLEALRRGTGTELALSCVGDGLRVAVLSPAVKEGASGLFDDFDFAQCRAFCEAARLCLDLTHAMLNRKDLWK